MPALGMAQASGVLVRWLVAEGGAVTEGDPLMEVETDKAVVEVPATASGTLADVAYGEGAEVAIGTVLAVLLAPGEAARTSGATGPVAPASSAPAGARSPGSSPARVNPAGASQSGAARAVLASPKAKRLARELGIDLAGVAGTGPAGAVRAVDLPAAGTATGRRSSPQDVAPLAATQNDTAWLRTDLDVSGLNEFLARVTKITADKRAATIFFPAAPSEVSAAVIDVPDVLARAVAAGLSHSAALDGSVTGLRLTVTGPTRTSAVLAGDQVASILRVARARAARSATPEEDPQPVEVIDCSGEAFERSPSPLDAATGVRFTLGPIREAVAVQDGEPRVRRLATLSLEYRAATLDQGSAAGLFTYVSRILGDPFSLAVTG